jgi:hypothetical protein
VAPTVTRWWWIRRCSLTWLDHIQDGNRADDRFCWRVVAVNVLPHGLVTR